MFLYFTFQGDVGIDLSSDGDQLFVFCGSVSAPSFAFGVSYNSWLDSGSVSSATSYLPSGLNASGAFVTLPFAGHQYYAGSTSGSAEEILANVTNASSWVTVTEAPSESPTASPSAAPTAAPTEYSCGPGSIAVISFDSGKELHLGHMQSVYALITCLRACGRVCVCICLHADE